jgi:hypothetical protein
MSINRNINTKQAIKWVNEPEAARLMGYTPRSFRRAVKERKIEVDYTSVNGRKYKYCEKGLNEFLLSQSTVTQ